MRKLALLALFATLITTNSLPIATAAPKTVFLAYQGPLTGDSEIFGQDQLAAVNFYVADFNKKYKSKFKVRLISLDDEGNDLKAAEISKSVAQDSRVIGVIGPAFSSTVATSIVNYADGRLAVISPSAIREPIFTAEQTIPITALSFFHRTALSGATQARDLLALATRGVVAPKVFLLHHEDSYSLNLANQLKEIAAPESLTSEQTPYAATNWGSTIRKILDEKFNVVIYTGYHPQAARFIKQLTDSGYTGIKALSDGSFSPGLLLAAPKSSLEGTRIIGLTAPLNLTQKSLFESIYGKSGDPRGIYAGETLEATKVFLDCITKNSLTRRKMNRCIDSYQGKSLLGEAIRFEKNGDLSQRALPSFVVRNGVFQIFTK